MENLIKRATDMCKKLNIDPDEVVEVKNLTTTFRGSVTDQSLIPTANFRFYERINSSFGFENTRYRYW